MRTSPRRYLALLGAFFVLPLFLAACGGGGVPGNSVIQIGDDTVKTSTFDHWMKVAATSQAQQSGQTGGAVVPDAPEFKACIANKAKTAPKPAKGQPTPSEKDFKTACQSEYNALRDQVMNFLISAAWVQGEAHDQGVKVPDSQVKKEFDQQRQQSFPKDTDYTNFLKSSGYIQEDLLYRIRVQDLSTKLREKVLKGKDKVSDQEIADYYNKNKDRFAQAERRDLRIVLTKDKAKAEAAKKALASGESWNSVAAKYSTDSASKDNGGKLPGVAKGQQEKALDDAVFAADKGELTGPIKTQFGYYVFDVTGITPKKQQTLEQSKETIKSLLSSQKQQKALNTFVKDFQDKWRERTECRSGFVVQNCKNAPKKKDGATTAAAPAAPAQNAPPANSGGTTTNK
jgi:foldase protein PrsA